MSLTNVQKIHSLPRGYIVLYTVIDDYGPCPDYAIFGQAKYTLTQEIVLKMARLVGEGLQIEQWPSHEGLYGSKTSFYQFDWEGKILVLQVVTYVLPIQDDKDYDW